MEGGGEEWRLGCGDKERDIGGVRGGGVLGKNIRKWVRGGR